MTQLAAHIHPNDSAFEELVRETWSRKEGPSLQRKRDFKSDLGDNVDQDVLEFIDEDEKKEFEMVKTAAKRRIQLAKSAKLRRLTIRFQQPFFVVVLVTLLPCILILIVMILPAHAHCARLAGNPCSM